MTKTFQPDDRDRRVDNGPAGWANRRGLSRKVSSQVLAGKARASKSEMPLAP